MGKGETCVRRASSELAEESHEKSEHALRQLQLLFRSVGHEAQISGDLQMAVKLGRRAERDSEATNELHRRTERVSFNKISGYGYGRATDLIRQPEVAAQRCLKGEPVGRPRELLGALPRLEGVQLFHGNIMRARRREPGVVMLRTGAEKRRSSASFPFPHSPFPDV